MTGVRLCETLTHEYVTQMPFAVGARNLRSHTVRVGVTGYSPRNLFIEGGPAAVGVELVHGPVQFGVALPADVGASFIKVVILACEWILGAFHLDYVTLLLS
jgi:hypothetical protein